MSLIKNNKIQAINFNELKNKIIAEVTGATRRELIVSAWGENNTIPDKDQYIIINSTDHNNLKNGLNTVYKDKFSTKSLGDIISGGIDSETPGTNTWSAMDTFVNTLSTYKKKNWKDDIGHAGCDADCRGLCSGCEGECTGCTNCTGSCSGTCTGTCVGTCTGGCGGCDGSCIGSCQGRCTGGCKGGCKTTCTAQCADNSCEDACTDSCVPSCGHSCQGCTGGCTGQCSTSCGNNISRMNG